MTFNLIASRLEMSFESMRHSYLAFSTGSPFDSMKRAQELSETIGKIYDAVLDPTLWPQVLERMCDAIDAKAASINVIDPIDGRAGLFVEHGTDPAWTALLLARYAGMSPIGAAVLLADIDQPVGAFDFVDEDEYLESRFYKEWCAPQDYYDLLGAVIAKRPREVGALSATRSRSKGKFGADERELIGLLAPHVRRAVTISGLLGQRTMERNALVSVIDQLACSVVVVARDGKLQRANRSAEAMCEAGGVIAVKDGKVRLGSADISSVLPEPSAPRPAMPLLLPVTDAGGRGYIAAVIAADENAGTYAVLINPQDADMPAVGKHLAALFGLTAREVSVLLPLLEGRTIDEAGESLGISEATARTHLKRLLTKTGTRRQTDLIQVVMKAMPPVRLGPER